MEILLGFLSGLIASWLFWKYLLQVKPDVKISHIIAKGIDPQNGQSVYRIKVINFGSRQAVNIAADCDVMELVDLGGGKKRVSTNVPLKVPFLMALGAKKFLGDMWNITPVWEIMLRPVMPLENQISEDGRLVLTLSATDAMSGTVVVQRVSYTKQQIILGDFKSGLRFDIVPINITAQNPAATLEAQGDTREVAQ